MTKDFPENTNIRAYVVLRDGIEYDQCDIPSLPFGSRERFFSFWTQDSLKIIPIDLIKSIDLYDANEEI